MPGRSSAVFLAAMFGFFFSILLPFGASAATEYEQPYVDLDYTGQGNFYTPEGSNIPLSTPETHFYTMTQSTTIVETPKPPTGCAQVATYLWPYQIDGAGNYNHNLDLSGATDHGTYCSFSYSLSAGDRFYGWLQGSGGVFSGSDDNGGYSLTSAQTSILHTGGPAFRLCTASGCDSHDFGQMFVDETSRIISTTPTNGTITASTTVDISINYFASSTSPHPLNEVVIELIDMLASYTQVFPPNESYGGLPIFVASTTFDTVATTTWSLPLLPNHTYAYHIFLRASDLSSELSPRPQWIVFDTLTNNWPSQLGTSPTTTYQLATSTCSIANITGCFQNALVWAFYPSEGAWAFLTSAYEPIKNKPPFGLTAYYDAFESIGATSTASSTISIPVGYMSAIFTPLRTWMGVLIYMAFAVWFFRRIRSHDI